MVVNAAARAAAFTFACISVVYAPPAIAAAAAPQTTAPAHPLHSFSSLALAPDGSRVAALESDEPAVDGDKAHVSLVIRYSTAVAPIVVALPCGSDVECTPSSPAWSPDGKQLAFVLKTPKGARAVYASDSNGTNVRKLAGFDGTIYDLRYGPDGRLAMLATAGAHKESGATSAGAAIVGEIGSHIDEQRIAILEGGALAFHSPADLYVYEFDWLPNGTGFVGTAATGDGDNDWWIAKLYAFDAATSSGRIVYAPTDPKQQLANPRVSPDGSEIAFIGGIMSDFGSTGGDVYVVPTAGAASARDLTRGSTSTATSLAWSGTPGASHLYYSTQHANLTGVSEAFLGTAVAANSVHAKTPVGVPVGERKRSAKQLVDDTSTATREPVEIWNGAVSISAGDAAFALSRRGRLTAVVRQDFEHAPEIAVGPLGAWRDLTDTNANVPSETHATPVFWKSDGFDVSGWLLAPLDAKAAGGATLPVVKHALITTVHGGPSAAYRPSFVGRGSTRAILRAGYYVFLPNPRGSYGEGEAFTLANVKDFGYGDLRDILSGIDAVERVAPIDEAKLGITGYSYGGYMTMWAVTQTHRFKAAVSGGGLSDWLSYYGQNGIDQWMIPFFGASVYDDPAVYARSAPITFIKNVTTPTFEYAGERDVETPAPQSQEFWHALVTFGVPTSFVVYPGEGHGIRQPKNRADAQKRTLDWFAKYLK